MTAMRRTSTWTSGGAGQIALRTAQWYRYRYRASNRRPERERRKQSRDREGVGGYTDYQEHWLASNQWHPNSIPAAGNSAPYPAVRRIRGGRG